MMRVLKGTALSLDQPTISKELLQEFLNSVPDDNPIQVTAIFQAKDRPYQSDRTIVQLRAEWEVSDG